MSSSSDFDTTIGRDYLHKICVIGDEGSGKSAFMKKFVHGIFSEHYKTTIGVDFALKVAKVEPEKMLSHFSGTPLRVENDVFRLQLWDIAGQERFGKMTGVYYNEASAAFLLFDSTRNFEDECKKVNKWKEDFDSKCGRPIILLVSKIDLGNINKFDEFHEFVRTGGYYDAVYISAKTGDGLTQAFDSMIKLLKELNTKQSKKDKSKVLHSIEDIRAIPVTPSEETIQAHQTNQNSQLECQIVTDVMLIIEDDYYSTEKKVHNLKLHFIELYFAPKMEHMRTELKKNDKASALVSGIKAILVETESTKNGSAVLEKIMNVIMNIGQNML